MLIGGSAQEQEHKKQQQMTISEEGGMFGSPLDERGVRFVEDSCAYLKNPENQVEGLFRISGSSSAIKYFRATMDAGKSPSFIPVEDAHNVASLLKMYLRELPKPIVSLKGPKEPLDDQEDRVMNALLDVMRTIDGNRELTRMDLPNLALVLGPNLIRDPSGEGSFEASADSSQILLQMAESTASEDKSTVTIEEEDEGYCIIPNANEQHQQEIREEEPEEKNDMEKVWAELESIKRDLETERQERRQLAELILPQLERTQLDLIEALNSMNLQKGDNLGNNQATQSLSVVIEETNEQKDDQSLKRKTD